MDGDGGFDERWHVSDCSAWCRDRASELLAIARRNPDES
ncbi:MAG: hypothetical protein QOE89_2977 [Pseudonocardiales bacterium]|nr:hypothetical protein [Pseudonocardiales bacterium]